jgi:hypothetical protein
MQTDQNTPEFFWGTDQSYLDSFLFGSWPIFAS